MNDEPPVCYCGHTEDEHEELKLTRGACTVAGCECFHYEENLEGDEE